MYGPGDVVSALDAFELGLLDIEWVNEIWREKFTSCPEDLPDEYSEKYSLLSAETTVGIMKECLEIIKQWLQSEPSSRAQGSSALTSWTALQEVSHKHLIALIYFYVKKSHSTGNAALVELGISAAEFYFGLLTIPGSSVYKIFQVTLFEACMEVFNVYKLLDKLNDVPEAKKQNKKKPTDADEEEEFTEEELTLPQQRSTIKLLNHLLLSFQHLVQTVSFKNHLEALKLSLSTLAELTRTERLAPLDVFTRSSDKTTFVPLARNAYLTLKDFCSEIHGRPSETIRLVLYRIMPNLSLLGGSAAPEIAKWSGREQTVVRNLALWFVRTCILPLGQSAHHGLEILIQQLSRQTIDRADYRGKATEMLISIISLLPEKSYFSVLKWIFREVITEGANHRVVALELISKLIFLKQGSPERSNMADPGASNVGESSRSHFEQSQSSQGGSSRSQIEGDNSGKSEISIGQARIISFCSPVEYVPIEYRRVMLAMMIDRLQDETASVRAKALIALSEVVSNRSSPTVQGLVRSIFVDPYQNLPAIDFGVPEPGFVQWGKLVAALKQVDVPETSKKLLPGGTVIVAKIKQRCLEERVNVRRCALALLVHIFKLNPQWMTKQNLDCLGQHCRDPAMQVRKEMVGCVTELMLHFPSHQQLTQLWVEEVVPQVADREIRVQEHALNVLTKTILANIKPLDKTLSSTDALPWHLLTHIASLKMRSFLVAACRLWYDARTPEFSPSRVAAIVTHIGSAQDAPAWVMLASLSEFVDIAQPKPIMDYYLEVVAKGEGDQGTANLVLTTMNNVWHKLKSDEQRLLQADLFESLKTGSVLPNLVPMVMNTATSMAVALSPDQLQGKKEMAMWAVETVQDCERHIERCLDATNEDRGKCEACIFNLTLLGSLADLHPDQISRSTFELIYSFMTTAKAVKDAAICKLKAVSVVTLARMALRDKYLASRLVLGLSKLISNYTDPVLLINVVVAVADIGERFPALIEPLVPALSLCLRNRHRNVREMTLVITIDLLQEDYLKARGALTYHLLYLINDPSPRTVSIVKFYFTNCILPKAKIQVVEQLLLGSMFHYNKYDKHPSYKKLDMEEAEEAAFNLSGPKMHRRRMTVYRFLISNALNPIRLRCFDTICHTILNGVGENIIDVNTMPGEQLLLDAFSVLMCEEMQLDGSAGGKKKADDEEDEESENPRKIEIKALLGLKKFQIIDQIIPICTKIRKVLVKNRKLTACLYCFVRELVRDYKSEIAQIFREDKQFGQEILHEINHIARGREEQDSNDSGTSEPQAEAVQAEVRESIATITGRSQKRKSDEHTDKEPKKQKSGGNGEENELCLLVGDLGVERGDSMGNEAPAVPTGGTESMPDGQRPTAPTEPMVEDTSSRAQVQSNDSMLTELRGVVEAEAVRKDSMKDKLSRKPLRNTRSQSMESTSGSEHNASQGTSSSQRTLRERSERISNSEAAVAKVGTKRITRQASSESLEDIEMMDSVGSLPMPPPARRPSRRTPITPTVPPRKPPLFSSTPLVATQQGFDATDISPVVQSSRNENSSA